MSRLSIITENKAQTTVEELYKDLERRISASPPGLCPVDMLLNFLRMSHAQSCGKCVPCRIGLSQLSWLIEDILDGKGSLDKLDYIEKTARSIVNTSDCAIGRDAARLVLELGATSAMPMHYGLFADNTEDPHPFKEFLSEFGIDVVIPDESSIYEL